MPETEEVRKAISYITGEIRLEYRPPNGFKITPAVTVDSIGVFVEPKEDGHDFIIWKYLAVVDSGQHDVQASLGNFRTGKNVAVQRGQTHTLNFLFSDSE